MIEYRHKIELWNFGYAEDHTMTPEAEQFIGFMSKRPGTTPAEITARTACDCGCGRPARVEIIVDREVISFSDPLIVDALVSVLARSRELLWGPPPRRPDFSESRVGPPADETPGPFSVKAAGQGGTDGQSDQGRGGRAAR